MRDAHLDATEETEPTPLESAGAVRLSECLRESVSRHTNTVGPK